MRPCTFLESFERTTVNCQDLEKLKNQLKKLNSPTPLVPPLLTGQNPIQNENIFGLNFLGDLTKGEAKVSLALPWLCTECAYPRLSTHISFKNNFSRANKKQLPD